jgi:hypothetical protein
MRLHLIIGAIVALGALNVGCGGSEPSPKTAAQVEVTPMEQLKSMSTELRAGAADLTKPIDQVQAILDDLAHLPEKYGLNLGEVMGMAKATLDSGKVALNVKVDISADAKTELQALLARLNEVVLELKRTPEKIATLTKKIAEDTALMPVLAGRVTVSASTTSLNPFVSAEIRAKAQADVADLQFVQQEVNATINETQAKIMGIPSMATNALAKLEASFLSGLDTGTLEASASASASAKLTGN